jgi:hypothetical protein
MQNLTREADFVLAKMLTGAVLVGAISDHGRPFRLGLPGAEAWEDVPHRVVRKLLDCRRIKVVKTRGRSQKEYCPAKPSQEVPKGRLTGRGHFSFQG